MLRIQRSSGEDVVLIMSGRIEIDDVVELERLLSLESSGQSVAFDLDDITLVDREAVPFLARSEAAGIQLRNCPAYIREWIDAERRRPLNPSEGGLR